MNATKKDTIYIDVDDEITSVIDKLKASTHSIIALVLPKRAAMLQSTVNMKLLKKAAKDSRKSIVLITNEHSILLLAGSVGVHVARSLQSAPTIPPRPERPDDTDKPIAIEPGEEPVNPKATVGELSGEPEEEETIEVDNDPPKPAVAAKKTKKDKRLKIPNFDQFRTRLFLGIGGFVLLFFIWFWAFILAPRGTVLIKTDTQSVTGTMDFLADASVTDYNQEQKLLPAATKELQRNLSEKVTATGDKNIGEKAKGTMTVTNCIKDDQKHTVPAGTTFTASGLSFASDEAITLDPALYSGNTCRSAEFGQSKKVGVTATQSGGNHNLSARSYQSSMSGISGQGSDMTGGSTKLVKVVAQSDVDGAVQRLTSQNATAADELKVMLAGDGFLPLAETIISTPPKVNATPKVGEEAAESTVTIDTTFIMLGVKEDDLKKLIESQIATQIDTSKQAITDFGIKDAAIRLLEKKSDKQFKLSLQTIVIAGPQIDANALKDEIRGKKRGDIEAQLNGHPGVKEVQISFKPFWVYTMPKAAKKITITVEQINNGQTP